MTKKQAIKWLKEAGYSSSYSGNTKTLYVHSTTQWYLNHLGLPIKFNLKSD